MDVAKILELLVEKGHLSEDILPQILSDDDFKKKRKERKKKTSEERRGVYDENKCQARVWLAAADGRGYDNIQCSFSKHEGGCMCKKHQGCVEKKGSWWLGKITEPRPEKIFHPVGGEHFWKTDKDGNEIEIKTEKNEEKETPENNDICEKDEKPVKRKRGRPKGSKNKTKKESKELSIEEITALLDQKKKEKQKEKETEDQETDDQETEKKETEDQETDESDGVSLYKVDGVPYEINGNDIMDPEDFSPIGAPDGKGEIIFEDEDAEERHKENIEKYLNN